MSWGSQNGDPLLRLEGINTYYGLIHILQDVNIEVRDNTLRISGERPCHRRAVQVIHLGKEFVGDPNAMQRLQQSVRYLFELLGCERHDAAIIPRKARRVRWKDGASVRRVPLMTNAFSESILGGVIRQE